MTCNGHEVAVRPAQDGLEIDGQVYGWDDLRWQNRGSGFVASREDLSSHPLADPTVLQYDNGTMDLSPCPRILNIVRQHV
ncbi:MAG: hypothetical protein M1294_13890 [Firmicutes bacterium]|nr:hypothetical protein [Bacillota bacterium]